MNDLSRLSDAELVNLYQSRQQKPAQKDLSAMSDEELVAAYQNRPRSVPVEQLWGNTPTPNAPASNQPTTLAPEIDRLLAQEAQSSDPKNAKTARVEQHIRRMEGEGANPSADVFMQGLTYGLSDELGAALQTLRGVGNYSDILDAERERLSRTKKDSPVLSTATEIAGAVANPVSRVAWAAQAPTRLARFGRGALEGGALSALYGFNQGEGGLANRATDAATAFVVGAPVGGAINAALPAVRGAVTQTPGSQVAEAAERIGVNLPRAVTSDNRATQQIGKAATNIPVAGLPLRHASEKAIGELDQAAMNVQRGYGNSNPAQAGDVAKTGLERFIGKTTKDKAKVLYDKVDNLVDDTIRTPLASTQRISNDILARRANAGITQESDAVRRISDAISRPQGLNYTGVKDLRSWIGETLDSGILPADLSKAELKQIYGALTNDLKASVANAGGTKAQAAWNRANTYYDAVSKRREALMRIVGAKSDEGVFDRILGAAGSTGRADQTLLAQVRRSLPSDEWNEVASAVIARMGRDPSFVTTPGNAVTKSGFSPERFMTAYGKLSPAGKTLLFRSTGQTQLAGALDDIATVSQRFKQLNTYANPSGTGQQLTGVAGLTALITEPMTTLSVAIPATVMSALLARPQSARSIARWSNAYYNAVAKPTRATLQGLQQANRTFADDIGRQLGVPQHAEALFKQLNSVVGASAEDQRGQ